MGTGSAAVEREGAERAAARLAEEACEAMEKPGAGLLEADAWEAEEREMAEGAAMEKPGATCRAERADS